MSVWEMSETDARAWLRKMVEVIREGLALTETTVDDAVCDMVLKALDSDLLWGWIWSVLDGILGDTDVVPIGAVPDDVAAEAEAVGFNPLLIIAILKALYDLWKLFRPDK